VPSPADVGTAPATKSPIIGEHLVRTAAEITPAWLTAVLRDAGALRQPAVRSVAVEPIGTGQAGQVVRVTLEYDSGAGGAPASVVVKLASTDDAARQTGVAVGIYEAEVRFYRELAPSLRVAVPRCYAAAVEPASGWFTLVLEDLSQTANPGDTLRGDSPERVELALQQLVMLHAAHWNAAGLVDVAWLDPARTLALFEYAPQVLTVFVERFGSRLEAADREVCERVVSSAGRWIEAAWSGPLVLQHGDFRLDNMLFGTSPVARPLTIVDWQAVKVGPPMVDVSLAIGGSLSVNDRRAHEQRLVHGYHDAVLREGVDRYPWDQCWHDYRLQCLYGLIAWVASCVHVQRTERGDALYLSGVQRHAAQALDLDALELLAGTCTGAPSRRPDAQG
jgi:aminoglycoside phosphotransferase (APT) family kinase protein